MASGEFVFLMTDAEFLHQIKTACLRFRAKYGALPEKIGIVYTRRLPMEWSDRMWFNLPTPLLREIAPDVIAVPACTRAFVQFAAFVNIEHDDFRLCSEAAGIVAPEELKEIELSSHERMINNLWH
jgi:hypothetical protein